MVARRELRFNRSLDAALARSTSPVTDLTPDGLAVLLSTLVSSVETLQTTVARLNTRVAYLEGQHQP